MLLLSSIEIENFRGIRHGKVEGLTEVNVLIGRNNCGKTTLAEAICRAVGNFGLSDAAGRVGRDYWHAVRAEKDDSGITNSRSLGKEPRAVFRYSLLTIEGGKPITHWMELDANLLRLNRNQLNRSSSKNIAKDELNSILAVQLNHRGMTVCRPLDATDAHIEEYLWPTLLQNRSDKHIAKALNEVFGLNAETFQLVGGKLLVLFENHSVPLDAQGDGTRAAMRALMLLTALKQTLFIMEEPECHQHPGSLEKFAKAVCNLAKTNEVQLVISTHSNECVKAFMKAAEGAKSSAAVFHLNLSDGIQTARRLDPDAVETLTETGVDVRFLDLYS
jgi:predicted ATPase